MKIKCAVTTTHYDRTNWRVRNEAIRFEWQQLTQRGERHRGESPILLVDDSEPGGPVLGMDVKAQTVATMDSKAKPICHTASRDQEAAGYSSQGFNTCSGSVCSTCCANTIHSYSRPLQHHAPCFTRWHAEADRPRDLLRVAEGMSVGIGNRTSVASSVALV